MSVEYVSREQWRGRGRPRQQANPAVIDQVQKTYDTGTAGRLDIPDGTSPAEVRIAVAELRRAARQLGLKLRLQPRGVAAILAARSMLFYGEDSQS